VRALKPLLAILLLMSFGCHPGPVISTSPKPSASGTIAGIVSTDTNLPLPGRTVTAIETQTGTRHEAVTGANGGYTIKVPEGTYRLEVQLVAGETVAKQPAETRVNSSDLDPSRHFVIAVR
jgi:hypothetical protein